MIFLVLDIFLLIQYQQKQRSVQFEYLTNAPMEEDPAISKENLEKLPRNVEMLSYVSATPKDFYYADLDEKLSDTEQSVKIVNKNLLRSVLSTPYKGLNPNNLASVRAFIDAYIWHGDQYEYWSYEKNTNKIILIQTYKGYPIYNNKFGRVELLLDNRKQVIGYLQTMLEDITLIGEKKEQSVVLSALEALKIIGEKGIELETATISDVKIGYYTYVPLTGTQVFTPTWYFKFDNGHYYFVNAIEGQIINDHLQLE